MSQNALFLKSGKKNLRALIEEKSYDNEKLILINSHLIFDE